MVVQNPARDEAVQWARELLGRSDWAVLDTETTGLDGSAQVIQVSVVGADGAVLLDTLIRPHGQIPREAIAVHGITDEMVADAPAYPDVHPTLGRALGNRTVVCYNAPFDARMLRQSALRHGLQPHPVVWTCAMAMYARYVGQWSSHHGGYRYQKLPRGPAYRGLKHQAVDDCLATLDLVRRMARA